MEDVTIHLRGGQSITVRAKKLTWQQGSLTGDLQSIKIVYSNSVEDVCKVCWLRLEAVDAIESRLVHDPAGQ